MSRVPSTALPSSLPLEVLEDMSSGTLTRYQQLADELAGSIRAGALRPGDRLPSVRELRRQRGVSPSTIFQAYAQLESDGLVHRHAHDVVPPHVDYRLTPLGLEVRQSVFGFPSLPGVAFVRWTLVHRGSAPLDSA